MSNEHISQVFHSQGTPMASDVTPLTSIQVCFASDTREKKQDFFPYENIWQCSRCTQINPALNMYRFSENRPDSVKCESVFNHALFSTFLASFSKIYQTLKVRKNLMQIVQSMIYCNSFKLIKFWRIKLRNDW